MKKKIAAVRPVLVTTEHRGVFFGYTELTDKELLDVKSITIRNARNCVKWVGTKGFVGLASTGPTSRSRVSPKVPAFTAHKVTAVIECTDVAAKAFEAEPWGA